MASSLRLGAATLSSGSPCPSSSRSTRSRPVQSARPLGLPEAGRASTTRSASAAAASECRLTTSLRSPGLKAPLRRFSQASNFGAAAGGRSDLSAGADPDLLPLRAAFARVVAPLAAALCLCNADRICLAVAIVPMAAELGWKPATQGLVQSAFLFGYAATQLVGGAAADRFGGRRVLGLGIAFFSLAQLATPALLAAAAASSAGASSSAALVSSRTLAAALLARAAVGLGEGVALPSMSSLVARHVPPSSRATALGAAFSGFHCGNLLGLALSPALLATGMGWRGMFAFFGAAGAPLLLFWFSLVPGKGESGGGRKPSSSSSSSSPSSPPSSSSSSSSSPPSSSSPSSSPSSPSSSSTSSTPPRPRKQITTPRDLLSSKHTWAIIAANVANHWGYFVYLSWLPSYFHRALGLDLAASSAASLGPWLLMAAGSSASGALADWLVSAKGWAVRRVRVTLQLVAFLVPAAALVTLVLAGGGGGGGGGASGAGAAAAAAAAANPSSSPPLHPALAIALVAAALGTTSLGQAGFVANMADVAPTAAGAMFGLCNTFGSAAGIAGVVGAGAIVQATGGSFAPLFLLTAGLYCVGAAVFATFASGEAVF